MSSPANAVVQLLIARECTMAAFVSQDPESSSNASLEEAIGSPRQDPEMQRGEQMNMEGSVDESCTVDDVSSQV